MTVVELLGRMPSAEIAEWQAYVRLEAEDAQRREMEARAHAGVAGRGPRKRR